MKTTQFQSLRAINEAIPRCKLCPRLRAHCTKISQMKRRSFQNETYWGRPVPAFGPYSSELILVGLAPAAHGANRTGRMFTGDRSGDWLYRALYRAGFANQEHSTSRTDGLKLRNAYITSAVKCAPPQNKPTPNEIQTCSRYLENELRLLKNAKVYLCLGQIGLNALWRFHRMLLGDSYKEMKGPFKKPKFGHNEQYVLPSGRMILMSYHPSQQNTFTKRLTEPMFDSVFKTANSWIKSFAE